MKAPIPMGGQHVRTGYARIERSGYVQELDAPRPPRSTGAWDDVWKRVEAPSDHQGPPEGLALAGGGLEAVVEGVAGETIDLLGKSFTPSIDL